MKIDSTSIFQWADRIEARSTLPVLVRRLIRETSKLAGSLDFPGGDAVHLPGFDGRTVGAEGNPWVPQGDAIWEMGCNQDPLSKANDDLKKRTDTLPDTERAKLAFVFVTPRRWVGKDAWLEAARKKGGWADVRAVDARDLEAWLEEAPVTTRWLGEKLGLIGDGLLSPEEWWDQWANASTPPISKALVTARRNQLGEQLIQDLRSDQRVMSISGDDRGEAIAFAIAALTEHGADDLLDRVLIVQRPEVALGVRSDVRPILIIDLPDGQDLHAGDPSRIKVVRPYPKGRLTEKANIELPHVGAAEFRSNLVKLGLSEDAAHRLALETGHSVAVLRRRCSDDPEVRRPRWADEINASKLLPFALSGSWHDGERQGDYSALELLSNRQQPELEQNRDSLLRLDDAPLAKYGNVNVVVSQLDALFAIGPFVRADDLDRFFDLFSLILGERDPALDLPRDQWWQANVLGKQRAYSAALISGLGDALCILAVHGNAICGDRLGIDLELKAARTVRLLMDNLSEDDWLSRRHYLRSFAEAAPIAFLDCLEAELRRPAPTIHAIMGIADGPMSGECLRTNLLWALEGLAWYPAYFSRVAEIALQLRRYDSKDNWSNSPANTAASLFQAWLPSTTLPVQERMVVLRRLAAKHRLPAIDVCISLLPNGGPRLGSPTSRHRWRMMEVEDCPPTHHDLQSSMHEARLQTH